MLLSFILTSILYLPIKLWLLLKREKCLKVHKMISGVISEVKISCMGNTTAVMSVFCEDKWCGCVSGEVVGLPCEEGE